MLDVAFEAPPGITALFGPSGAGKTLTLRCIAGLERPRAGRIALNDRVLFDHEARIDVPARERHLGYVFQRYALLPHLTVGENLRYGLHRWPRAEREQRVAELLALMGLEGYQRRRPAELSGGEEQRVALARALAPRPALLLLDEPFAALDARVRSRLRRELRRVQEATGVPMILVTHDLAEVQQLAPWLVVYDQGRVLCSGSTQDVLAHPGSKEAADILRGEEP
jgi:ABC-type sulfate/molybdate transport systems ATPase subunit